MPIRDKLQNTIEKLQTLLDQYEAVAAATASRGEVEASLVNVRAAHDKVYAELVEQQRLLEAERAKHKAEMSAMETSLRVVKAKVATLLDEAQQKQTEIDGLRQYHDELLASIQSLKKKLAA